MFICKGNYAGFLTKGLIAHQEYRAEQGPSGHLLLGDALPAQAEMITRVVDGDTVDVRMPTGEIERVRLLCVDTPESVHPDRSRNVPMGQVASDYTRRMLYGKTVSLIYEDGNRRGRYGRLLAYILVEGVNFNVELVRQGLSSYYTKYGSSTEFDEKFKAAEVYAKYYLPRSVIVRTTFVDGSPSTNPTRMLTAPDTVAPTLCFPCHPSNL